MASLEDFERICANLDEQTKPALKKFSDPDFPPRLSSYCAEDQNQEIFEDYQWVRAQRMANFTDEEGDVMLDLSSVTPKDLESYTSENHALMNALQVLAENPKNIEKLFLRIDKKTQGIYALQFYQDKKATTVLIDDFLVTYEEFPLTMESQLWAHLIEKAWAKLHGNFFKSFEVKKSSQEIYQDLTGADTECISIQDDTFDLIKQYKKQKHVLVIKSKSDDYLPTNFDYAIEEVKVNKEQKDCKIRKPAWVAFEGEWGDENDEHSAWLAWEVVQQKFSELIVCKVGKNDPIKKKVEKAVEDTSAPSAQSIVSGKFISQFSSKSDKTESQVLSMQVSQPGEYTFTVSQGPVDETQKFSDVRLYTVQFSESAIAQEYKYLNGSFKSNEKEVKLESKFEESGLYYLVVEIDWIGSTPEKTMTVENKGPQELQFVQETSMSKNQLLEKALPSILEQNKKKVRVFTFLDDENQYQSQYNMNIGYDIQKYSNESISSSYCETVEFPGDKGMTLCIPDDEPFYSVNLKPNETQYVVFRQNFKVMTDSLKLGYNSILGDDNVVCKVQEKGVKKNLSKDESIYSKVYKHESGYVITYKNRSKKNETYNEELQSDTLTADDKSGKHLKKTCHFQLKPNENMLVKFIMVPGDTQYEYFTFKSYKEQTKIELYNIITKINERVETSTKKDDKELLAKHKTEQSLTDGSKYLGVLKNGMRSGYGKHTMKSGDKYYGNFTENMIQGKGIIIYNNGDIYEGDFKDGLNHGKGCFVFDYKIQLYEGEWSFDNQHGKGSLFIRGGDKYVGQFKDGEFEGDGIYTEQDGSSYEGQFKEGKRHGTGVYKFKSGQQKQVQFEQGALVQ